MTKSILTESGRGPPARKATEVAIKEQIRRLRMINRASNKMKEDLFKFNNLWQPAIMDSKKIEEEISIFQLKHNLLIPEDLALYFKFFNGTRGEYDERFYQFYSLDLFKDIFNEFRDWKGGSPDYSNLINKIENPENCFVFANYQCYLFSYCIRLHKKKSGINEIYMLCGDKFKVIANSFTQFLELYLAESIELEFNI